MLTLDNVSVNYGAIEALRGISMHVEKGEVVTLIGANGAGKTTTLRTITGLLSPREGTVTFEGDDIGGKATHKLVARGISMSGNSRTASSLPAPPVLARTALETLGLLPKGRRRITLTP